MNCGQEPFRPKLCFFLSEPFKDFVLNSSQPFRDSEFNLILRVIVLLERTADSASFTIFPSFALNQLVSKTVFLDPLEIFLLNRFIVKICFHFPSNTLASSLSLVGTPCFRRIVLVIDFTADSVIPNNSPISLLPRPFSTRS